MIVIACILLLLYGLFEYLSDQKGRGAFVFFFFLTNGFHFLNTDWSPVKYTDFSLVYLGFVILLNIIEGNYAFLKPKMKIYKVAILIGIYVSAEFVRTIVMKEEIASFALANYRTYLPFFSFFIVQELRLKEISLLFKQIAVITIISTILFDIQPLVHIRFLQHGIIDKYISGTYERFRNIPYLAYFFLLLYTIKLKLYSFKSVVLLLIFGVAIVLTQHRGVMLAYITCVGVYLVITKKGGKAIQYGIIGVVFAFFASDMIISRFEGKNNKTSTIDDIKIVMNLDYKQAVRDEFSNDGGTLSFRVLLLMERVNYLVHNPRYLLFGIGTRHEDSPYTTKHFRFNIGTHKQGTNTFGQISSADLVWVNPLMRFGIIGVGLLLYFSWLIISFLYRNRKQSDVAMGAFLFYMLLLFISFKNDHLYENMQIYFMYLLLEYIRRMKKINTKHGYINIILSTRN